MSTSWPPPTRFSIEQRKITAYLLNPSHPDGASKAKFFLARGFAASKVQVFAQRLLDHPVSSTSDLTSTVADVYAVKFVYEGPLRCPDGSIPWVRTVWEVRTGDAFGRLVTAYPL